MYKAESLESESSTKSPQASRRERWEFLIDAIQIKYLVAKSIVSWQAPSRWLIKQSVPGCMFEVQLCDHVTLRWDHETGPRGYTWPFSPPGLERARPASLWVACSHSHAPPWKTLSHCPHICLQICFGNSLPWKRPCLVVQSVCRSVGVAPATATELSALKRLTIGPRTRNSV